MKSEMAVKLQERLDFLKEISIPHYMEWADANVPQAIEYINKSYNDLQKAIVENDGMEFKVSLEKYEKACLRVFQLMAQDHCGGRDIMDVSMVYYRHMPDGNTFVMDSKTLGCKIMVFPRKPKQVPDMRWVTAGELIKMHENPILFDIITLFDAWYDRSVPSENFFDKVTYLSKKDAKRILSEGGGMKLKTKKHGWDCYE
jgi:hypothetical protein